MSVNLYLCFLTNKIKCFKSVVDSVLDSVVWRTESTVLHDPKKKETPSQILNPDSCKP